MKTCRPRIHLIIIAAAGMTLVLAPPATATTGNDLNRIPDGVYRLQTEQAPSPVLAVENGRVVRSAGELADSGCVMKNSDTIFQQVSLEKLFSEQGATRRMEQQLKRHTYHSNQWQGENPFGYSKVDLAMNQEAGLEVTHTVVTYLANPEKRGNTVCNRRHRYQTIRLN